MNNLLAAILVLIALQFAVILPVAANEGVYPLIKTTACPGAAYTFKYHNFTYVPDEFEPFLPQRTHVPKINRDPYVYRLREQLTVGQAVTIRGIIPENDEFVSITLLSKAPFDDENVGDTALHMSIRIGYKLCHFNSKKDRIQWGQGFDKPLNLSYNEEFEIVIRALTDGFAIVINGEHYADFPYRIPLEIIEFVSMQFNAIITEFRIGGRQFNNISKVNFPYGHLDFNERVVIEGVSTADDFAINFLDANGGRAFHIRPYFSAGVVVLDSEPFGKPEQSFTRLFTKSKHFMLELINRVESIQIYVNRKYLTTFKHRINNPHGGYKAVSFSSSVTINGLEICTN